MSRLAVMFKVDIILQKRYGFYYAAVFVTMVWIAALAALPAALARLALPYVIFGDLAVIGFFFIAGQIIFEKTERTLYALVVSPLRFGEYLGSKLAAYTLMSILASLAIAIAGYGIKFNLFYLSLGVILVSIVYTQTGFIAVAPYRSISSFLVPSQLYLLILGLPVIHFAGWVNFPLFFAFPTMGALYLLKGVLGDITVWQAIYSVFIQAVWIIILSRICRYRFDRYIAAQKGGIDNAVLERLRTQ